MNCQVVNFQRCEHTYGPSKEPEAVPWASGMSETAARPPSPAADGPPALPAPTSASQWVLARSHDASLWMPGSGLLQRYFSRYCTVRLKVISLFFVLVFYVLFVLKYYKPRAVQYCTVNCISWVPRLTSLERTNRTYECSLRMELYLYAGDLLYCHYPTDEITEVRETH